MQNLKKLNIAQRTLRMITFSQVSCDNSTARMDGIECEVTPTVTHLQNTVNKVVKGHFNLNM